MSNFICDTTETFSTDPGLLVSAHFPDATQGAAFRWAEIGARLHETVRSQEDQLEMLRSVGAIVADSVASHATLYLLRDDADGSLLPGRCIQGSLENIDTTHDALVLMGKSACSEGRAVSTPLGEGGSCPAIAIAVPVPMPCGESEVLISIVSAPAAADAGVTSSLALAAVHIAWWRSQRVARLAEYEVSSTAALQELLEQMEMSETVEQACHLLATQMQAYFGCQQVAVALRGRAGGQNRLRAIAGIDSFDRHAPLASAIESALDEAVIRDSLTVWPPPTPSDRFATLAHQKLVDQSGMECVVSSPLRGSSGENVGAWLFLGTRQCLSAAQGHHFLLAAATRVAACLSLLQRARRGYIDRCCRSLLKRGKTVKGGLALLTAAVLAGLLAVPMDYHIRCDCRIEPVSRRFAAAPYDGILQETLVDPGAMVVRGDALARMDGREIRWELASVRAERDRAAKKRDAAFANHKFAAAEIARLELERHESKIELLEQRQENLVVKSPIDGVVTSGDLDQAQGAPVTRGQTLFEIAPLGRMVVEIAIPEREVPYVQVGQNVRIRLESRPGAQYSGTIENIHPRAEIRERENVFIAQVILANPNGELRPGMQGTAKIEGPRHALAWNLFHKPWESLCMTCGW